MPTWMGEMGSTLMQRERNGSRIPGGRTWSRWSLRAGRQLAPEPPRISRVECGWRRRPLGPSGQGVRSSSPASAEDPLIRWVVWRASGPSPIVAHDRLTSSICSTGPEHALRKHLLAAGVDQLPFAWATSGHVTSCRGGAMALLTFQSRRSLGRIRLSILIGAFDLGNVRLSVLVTVCEVTAADRVIRS